MFEEGCVRYDPLTTLSVSLRSPAEPDTSLPVSSSSASSGGRDSGRTRAADLSPAEKSTCSAGCNHVMWARNQ
jgi:hypothetical protein